MSNNCDKVEKICVNCEHLMFSDCYGECGIGKKGIVMPNDTCDSFTYLKGDKNEQ